MFECFHCCTKSVVWDADFDFSDWGLEGEGVVHVCHCTNCGAEIYYFSGVDFSDVGVEGAQQPSKL